MGRGFCINAQITGQQYVFTLTEPPTLALCITTLPYVTTYSRQVEIGRGFNKHCLITGDQYTHMTYTLWSEFQFTIKLELSIMNIAI